MRKKKKKVSKLLNLPETLGVARFSADSDGVELTLFGHKGSVNCFLWGGEGAKAKAELVKLQALIQLAIDNIEE